jgi:hypothetical protein
MTSDEILALIRHHARQIKRDASWLPEDGVTEEMIQASKRITALAHALKAKNYDDRDLMEPKNYDDRDRMEHEARPRDQG